MDIRYLREFLVLAERENYTEAAEELFVSQSSLFKHIKLLEGELGVALFEKRGKHIELGDYGRIFVPYAQKMSELDIRCRQKIQSKKSMGGQRVMIWSNYYMSDLAVSFHMKHEGILLDIREGSSAPRQVKSVVESRMYDVLFLVDQTHAEELMHCVPFVRERLVLAVNADNPLAARESVTMDDLRDESFILFHDYGTKNGAYNPHNAPFKNIDYIPKSQMRANRGKEMVDMVQRGYGVAVLSKGILERKQYEGIAMVELEPDFEYTVWCCYPKGLELSDGARLLLDFCEEEGREIYGDSDT